MKTTFRARPRSRVIPINDNRLTHLFLRSPHLVFSIPPHCPGRTPKRHSIDPNSAKFYGDAVIQKIPGSNRIFFQNIIKGLTHSLSQSRLSAGATCLVFIVWTGTSPVSPRLMHVGHIHISNLTSILAVRRYFQQRRISFGSPDPQVDPCPGNETLQAGGNLTLITGFLSSRSHGTTPAILRALVIGAASLSIYLRTGNYPTSRHATVRALVLPAPRLLLAALSYANTNIFVNNNRQVRSSSALLRRSPTNHRESPIC